ncbi:hypothetical protein C8J56DRAFT_1085355 [Mycena floridula]|nr:hypothetical protein C8J56DRAFT_1085355 [Mycena floridula]
MPLNMSNTRTARNHLSIQTDVVDKITCNHLIAELMSFRLVTLSPFMTLRRAAEYLAALLSYLHLFRQLPNHRTIGAVSGESTALELDSDVNILILECLTTWDDWYRYCWNPVSQQLSSWIISGLRCDAILSGGIPSPSYHRDSYPQRMCEFRYARDEMHLSSLFSPMLHSLAELRHFLDCSAPSFVPVAPPILSPGSTNSSTIFQPSYPLSHYDFRSARIFPPTHKLDLLPDPIVVTIDVPSSVPFVVVDVNTSLFQKVLTIEEAGATGIPNVNDFRYAIGVQHSFVELFHGFPNTSAPVEEMLKWITRFRNTTYSLRTVISMPVTPFWFFGNLGLRCQSLYDQLWFLYEGWGAECDPLADTLAPHFFGRALRSGRRPNHVLGSGWPSASIFHQSLFSRQSYELANEEFFHSLHDASVSPAIWYLYGSMENIWELVPLAKDSDPFWIHTPFPQGQIAFSSSIIHRIAPEPHLSDNFGWDRVDDFTSPDLDIALGPSPPSPFVFPPAHSPSYSALITPPVPMILDSPPSPSPSAPDPIQLPETKYVSKSADILQRASALCQEINFLFTNNFDSPSASDAGFDLVTDHLPVPPSGTSAGSEPAIITPDAISDAQGVAPQVDTEPQIHLSPKRLLPPVSPKPYAGYHFSPEPDIPFEGPVITAAKLKSPKKRSASTGTSQSASADIRKPSKRPKLEDSDKPAASSAGTTKSKSSREGISGADAPTKSTRKCGPPVHTSPDIPTGEVFCICTRPTKGCTLNPDAYPDEVLRPLDKMLWVIPAALVVPKTPLARVIAIMHVILVLPVARLGVAIKKAFPQSIPVRPKKTISTSISLLLPTPPVRSLPRKAENNSGASVASSSILPKSPSPSPQPEQHPGRS